EHPLGRAIVDKARELGCVLSELGEFEAISGKGIRATVDDKVVLVGSPKFILSQDIALTEIEKDIQKLQSNARTAVVVVVDNVVAGIIGIADKVKASSLVAINQLNALGIETAMLTGDNQLTAEAIAREVGISTVYADVLPADKSAKVESLQSD